MLAKPNFYIKYGSYSKQHYYKNRIIIALTIYYAGSSTGL